MNTLERLKELNATTGQRNGGEDLGHWADRDKRENMWVRDVALPDLLELVEAVEEYEQKNNAYLNARSGEDKEEAWAVSYAYEKMIKAKDALAKLTEEEG